MKSKLRKILVGIVTFAVLGVTAAVPASTAPTTESTFRSIPVPGTAKSPSGRSVLPSTVLAPMW